MGHGQGRETQHLLLRRDGWSGLGPVWFLILAGRHVVRPEWHGGIRYVDVVVIRVQMCKTTTNFLPKMHASDPQINIPRFNRHDGRLRTTDKIRLTAHPWLCPALFSPLIVLIDSSRVETQHHPLAAPYSLTYSALVLPYPASLFYRVIFGSIYSDSGRQPAGPPAAWVSASELCRNFQVLEDCHPRFRYGTANF